MTKNEKPGCLAGMLRMLGINQKGSATRQEEAGPLPYLVRDDFFSQAEGSFYRVLRDVVGEEYVICPKVSLREIFFVSRPNENRAFYNRIDRKHVDYLLCEARTLRPAMAIELDDKSHRRPDRIERDEFVEKVFEGAGLRLVRIPVKMGYSTEELRRLIYPVSPGAVRPAQARTMNEKTDPVCPKCGVKMVLRTATRGPHAGKNFYGCPNFPSCREYIAATSG